MRAATPGCPSKAQEEEGEKVMSKSKVLPCVCVSAEAVELCSGVVWGWLPGVWILGASWEGYTGPGQLWPVPCSGMSYKVACRWLPLVLAWEVLSCELGPLPPV